MLTLNKKIIENWFYELWYGHPFLLDEEVDIICETRANDNYKWMNDIQIQHLVKRRIKEMYKKKFPKSK